METHLTVELMIERDGKVFMVKRKNTGFMDGHYAFVGGHVEHNESLKQAGVREAKEECGIDIKEEDMEFICGIRNGKKDDYFNFFYKVTNFLGEPQNIEKDKCEEIRWIDLKEIPENTVPNEKRAIYNYLNNVKIDEYNF